MSEWKAEGAVIYAEGPWWKRLWWKITKKWPKVVYFDDDVELDPDEFT